MKKLMIGGQALRNLGSTRFTDDVDYLYNNLDSKEAFVKEPGADYLNANGNPFFKAVWDLEENNDSEIASLQALAELKAFAWVQHFQNGNFKKVADCEFDLRFLASKGVKGFKIVSNFVASYEYKEVIGLLK